jgi:hypothetical protein
MTPFPPTFPGRESRIAPDVRGDPVDAVGCEGQQEEARKEYAKENARREGQGMDAQGAQEALRLAQEMFELFHAMNP